MNAEIITKINELKKLGVSTSGLPDQWRREVCDLIASGTSVAEVSKSTGINIVTIESWVRKYKPKKPISPFKEANVIGPEFEATSTLSKRREFLAEVLYKIEVRSAGCTTTLQSTDKRELIRYLEMA